MRSFVKWGWSHYSITLVSRDLWLRRKLIVSGLPNGCCHTRCFGLASNPGLPHSFFRSRLRGRPGLEASFGPTGSSSSVHNVYLVFFKSTIAYEFLSTLIWLNPETINFPS